MHHHFAWSALTCSFPGASVFLGMSSFREQRWLAEGLSFRSLRVFADGALHVVAAGRRWPIAYFAVRDPAAVRIVPIPQQADPGFEHARLLVSVPKSSTARNAYALSGLRAQSACITSDAEQHAFLLTVGLQANREEDVFMHTLVDEPEQDWEQVRLRLSELGCGDRPKRTNARRQVLH
jgi:hypothetical protein